jgi:hypothetical protein
MSLSWSDSASEHESDMDYRRWSPRCERPDDLVRPIRVDPKGVDGPTPNQARGPRWRQTSPGLFVPSTVDASRVEQRIFEQGHRIRTQGAVGSWAALRWYGAAYFEGTDHDGDLLPVPLLQSGRRLRSETRAVVEQSQLSQSERVQVADMWVTTVQRALFDVMRAATLREAVVAMDMTAAARLISVSLMTQYVAHRPAWSGVPLVRKALALSTNDSRSPMETRMRLVWILDALLAPPRCNVPVFSLGGTLLGYPDVLDVESGTIGEYDGADHKEGERHRLDVEREQRYRDHGLEYFTVVGGDIRDRRKVAERMHSTRARAKFLPEDQRRWTLEPPAWWKPREEELDVHLLRTGEAPLLVRT